METARLGELTQAQIDAYQHLQRWVKANPHLEPWSPYLIAAGPDGSIVRVLLGYAPPLGYVIIGPNCAHTGAIHRVQDLRDGNKGIAPSVYSEWTAG